MQEATSVAEIMGISAAPGERSFGYADVANLASGARLRIAIHVLAGASPGPTLLVGSTSRGDEIATILTVRELLSRVSPAELKGTLVAVPLMNPPAFETQTDFTELDGWRLDEAFPVAKTGPKAFARGWATEQIAGCLAQLVNQADCVIDLHAGAMYCMSNAVRVIAVGDEAYQARVAELSKAYGLQALYLARSEEGSLADYAALSSIPVVTPEFGGVGPFVEQLMQSGLNGVLNVMRHLGMLSDRPDIPQQQWLFRENKLIRSKTGGMFFPEVGYEQLNETVPGGTVLGRILSPLTLEEQEVLTAPYEETYLLMLHTIYSRVHPGECIYIVGNKSGAERI